MERKKCDNCGITNTPCVILEVDMPNINWCKHWEFVTYDSIPIKRIKRLK